MNETIAWLCGGALLLIGFIGCFVPVLPGPIIAYAALWLPWLLDLSRDDSQLWIGGVIVAAVTIIDYVLPSWFAKKFKCSRRGIVGCFIGSIVGMFFMPWGIILGPVIGTVLGELLAGKTFAASAKGGLGAFCGFVTSLLAKLASVGLFAYWFFNTLV